MLKPYDSQHDGKTIDSDNCEEITGYTHGQLVSLTGIWGTGVKLITVRFYDEYPVLRILHRNDWLLLVRSINLKGRFIYNERFILKRTGSGRGRRVLLAEIDAAVKAGIKEIKVWAYGNYRERKKYNGYITWGKFGFTMYQPWQKQFEDKMKEAGRSEKTLDELLSSEGGSEVWEKLGFTWYGHFELGNDSENWAILKKYLAKKKKL